MIRPRRILLPIKLALLPLLAACSTVDVVRLTDQSFSPKTSRSEVSVLEHEPDCPHLRLAELRVDDSSASYGDMQEDILNKAMTLGADAVVFGTPQSQVRRQIMYQPAYSPWGYGAYGYPGWGYGPWGYGSYGYGWGGMAMPYDYTVRSLKGVAIRYSTPSGARC